MSPRSDLHVLWMELYTHTHSLFWPPWVSGKTAYITAALVHHHSTICYEYAVILYIINVQLMLEINYILFYSYISGPFTPDHIHLSENVTIVLLILNLFYFALIAHHHAVIIFGLISISATNNKLRVAYNNVYRRILGYTILAERVPAICLLHNFDNLIRKKSVQFSKQSPVYSKLASQ